ncbi:hypothetical protein GCM10022239_11780 [Leifsonia bigeumensis]|uniref:DUF2158 domain-containing protein n=1 Tax=Leifsonella bigeumensis TaxID=433643 RepID=A0ABP7FEB9_9MICO
MTEQADLQPGDVVIIDDFGEPRTCTATLVSGLPDMVWFRGRPADTQLWLIDRDGRAFRADMPRWEGRR